MAGELLKLSPGLEELVRTTVYVPSTPHPTPKADGSRAGDMEYVNPQRD